MVQHESNGESKTEPNLIEFGDVEANDLVAALKGVREQAKSTTALSEYSCKQKYPVYGSSRSSYTALLALVR